MERIHIDASTSYDVIIERNSLCRIGQFLENLKKPCTALIVTDDIVGPLYASVVRQSLESAGYTVHTYTFPHGESEKNSTRLIDLIETMASLHLSRKDLLVALGGGVVGDLGGFAAATYLRGIDYVQVPTSLLAAVDSSVGGKTAVNLQGGKNLWGAFKQPILVLCDPTTLDTLDEKEWINGCGEIIKYGFLDQPDLLDHLLERPLITHREDVDSIIATCVKVKARIVMADEKESGLRALLNLGHTFGHGIEHASEYRTHHGYAVAIGLYIMAKGAIAQGHMDNSVLSTIQQLLESHQLPIHTSIGKDSILEAAAHDKKASQSTITIVIPTGYGRSELKTIPLTDLSHYLIL